MEQEELEALQAPAKLSALSCAPPVSPYHADLKRAQTHDKPQLRAHIFQNRHPTWFSLSWLVYPLQAVKAAWFSSLPQQCLGGRSALLTQALLCPSGESLLLSMTQLCLLHGLPGSQYHTLQGRMMPRQGSPGSAPGSMGVPAKAVEGMLLCC